MSLKNACTLSMRPCYNLHQKSLQPPSHEDPAFIEEVTWCNGKATWACRTVWSVETCIAYTMQWESTVCLLCLNIHFPTTCVREVRGVSEVSQCEMSGTLERGGVVHGQIFCKSCVIKVKNALRAVHWASSGFPGGCLFMDLMISA